MARLDLLQLQTRINKILLIRRQRLFQMGLVLMQAMQTIEGMKFGNKKCSRGKHQLKGIEFLNHQAPPSIMNVN